MMLRLLYRSASLLLLLVVQVATESASPVQNLEPSLAASSAHSSAVAVESKDGVVLLYRSATRPVSKLLASPSFGTPFEKCGLQVCKTSTSSSSRWNLLAPNCFCTMTGFSADITHVTKVLARTVESHQVLYHQQLPIHKCVRSLSSMIQRATQRGGGRPFGVQALVLGVDGDQKWQLYSCDPTGLYRHFPKGRAAIGKFANPIEIELSKEEISTLAKEALELCLASIVQASTKENVKLDLDSFEGLFLWTSETGECQVAQIDPSFLDECYEKVQAKANLKESKAS